MVEGARLESVLSRKGYESSNLSLSAMNHSLCHAGFMPCTGAPKGRLVQGKAQVHGIAIT